jgi:Zn-dependent metalloprotease
MLHCYNCQFVPHYILSSLEIFNGEDLNAPDVRLYPPHSGHHPASFEITEPRKVNIQAGFAPMRHARLHAVTPLKAGLQSQAGHKSLAEFAEFAATPNFPVYDLNGTTSFAVDQQGTAEYQAQLKSESENARLKGDDSAWPKSAQNAFNNAQKVFQFYKELFGRNSINGKGMDVISGVRLRTLVTTVDQNTGEETLALDYAGKPIRIPENNAFWDGKMMCYGEGDNVVFTDFTAGPDVIGHELTHGVTQYTCALRYEGQSGALNEHLSDAFGIAYRHWLEGEKDPKTANWFIGDKIISDDFKRMVKVRNFGHWDALRSMAAPGTAFDVKKDQNAGKDLQPAHMKDLFTGDQDNGGVHINSGIPNHAFYLFATSVPTPSWDIPARVWYQTITTAKFGKLVRDSSGVSERVATFQEFANATITAAKTVAPDQVQHLQDAWKKVGVLH